MNGSYLQRDRAWHSPALTPSCKTSVLRNPRKAPLSFPISLSEETGPVFGHDVPAPLDDDLIRNFGKAGAEAIGHPLRYPPAGATARPSP